MSLGMFKGPKVAVLIGYMPSKCGIANNFTPNIRDSQAGRIECLRETTLISIHFTILRGCSPNVLMHLLRPTILSGHSFQQLLNLQLPILIKILIFQVRGCQESTNKIMMSATPN